MSVSETLKPLHRPGRPSTIGKMRPNVPRKTTDQAVLKRARDVTAHAAPVIRLDRAETGSHDGLQRHSAHQAHDGRAPVMRCYNVTMPKAVAGAHHHAILADRG